MNMEQEKSMESRRSIFFGQQVPAPTTNTFDFAQSSAWNGNNALQSNARQSSNKDAQRYTKQPFKIQGRPLPMEPGEATDMLLRQHDEDDTPSSGEGWQRAAYSVSSADTSRQAPGATDSAYRRDSDVHPAFRQQSPESVAPTTRAAKQPKFRPLNREERAERYNLNKEPRLPRESKQGWAYVESLSRQRICAAAMEFAPKGATSVKLLDRPKGQNNLGAILQFDNGVKAVMRIPACGSPGWWDSNGKRTLRNTVEAMKYIKAQTGLKVPEVLDYSMTCDNKLGAPYVAMSFMEGRPVSDVWWDHQGMAFSGDFVTVSPDLEKKRQRILKSIANQVFELRKLRFPQSGYLKLEEGNVDKPKILFPTIRPFGDQVERHKHNRRAKTAFINRGGDEADWVSEDESIASEKMREAHTSSFDEHTESLNTWYKYALEEAESLYPGVNVEEDLSTQMIHGLHKIYSIMIGYLPHGALTKEYSNPEKFSLFQSDFNPQNIFVDEDCNVTGFIDWDLTDTRPCYVGWARIPLWLCEDWDFSHLGRAGKLSWPNPKMAYPASVDLQRYRKDYARYLLEACDRLEDCDDDWKYALKCHILDAVLVTVGSETQVKFRFLERLFDHYVGTFGWKFHLEKIGREGFEPGLKDFYHRFFRDLFHCDADAVRAELRVPRPADSKPNVAVSVRSAHSIFADRLQAELETQALHEELKNAYKEQLDFCREQIACMQKLLELQHTELAGSPPKSFSAQSASRSAPSRSAPDKQPSWAPQAAVTQIERPARPADLLFEKRAPNQALAKSSESPQRAGELAETFAVWHGKPPKCSDLEIGRPGIDLDPLSEEELRDRTALKDEEVFYADPSNFMMSGAIQTKSEDKRRWSDSFRKPARKAMKLLERDSRNLKSRKELQRLIEEGTMGAWRKKSSDERKDPASKPSSPPSAASTGPPSTLQTSDAGSQGNGSQTKDGSSGTEKPGERSSTGSQGSLMRRVANLLLKGYRDHSEKVGFPRDPQSAGAYGNVPHHESMSRGIMVI